MTATTELAELERKLDDLGNRYEAVVDVLRTLSHSGMRLQPILDQIVEAATRLCHADHGLIHLAEGELLHVRASFGSMPENLAFEREHPDRAGPGSCAGRVAMTRKPVHIPDVLADPDYTYPMHAVAKPRTLLGVPVIADDDLVGVIGLARSDVRPYDQGEIDLVATFADQCAVAIVGADLFETVERQKAELARFLSPQVAALVSSKEGGQLLAGHRAYVSVLYSDLRGFTAFAETAEPEELFDVLREYHAAVGELVVEHEGTLEHFAGDGVMVIFNDPAAVEDHELEAVRVAVALQGRVGALATGWRKRGYDLGLGVGIAVGHATLGRIGFEGRYGYGTAGAVVNLASRLSDEARAGEVLLSQRAFATLEESVEAELVGELTLKGFSRPMVAYRLVRLRD